jgi:predicted nucleotidyltransferase component of viral defense system
MTIEIIQGKLNTYQANSVQEEEQALREITQEVILAGLSRSAFFKAVAFQGGTALRIFYNMNRFSEDLDFTLCEPDTAFALDPFVRSIINELKAYGFQFEAQDRSKAGNAVQKLFMKDDSVGKILTLRHLNADRSARAIRVKVEVDTNPPPGGLSETKFLQFPFASSVRVQTKESLFAGKMHALLCREYAKGRDWYDLLWYCAHKTDLNTYYLQAALMQHGPWKGKALAVTRQWWINEIRNRIHILDVEGARNEVLRFVREGEQPTLSLWSKDFFLSAIDAYEKTVE